MSDTHMVPTHPVEIPAKYIQQAHEHLRMTGEKYVSLLFTDDMTCVGITTRQTTAPTNARFDISDAASVTPPPIRPAEKFVNLTNETVLAVVAECGRPIGLKYIGDALGVAGNDSQRRQRIRRVLDQLLKVQAVHPINVGARFPKYAIGPGQPAHMAVRPRTTRLGRRDITEELVLHQIQSAGAPVSSRHIGDMLGILRPNVSVRAKITENVQKLIKAGRIKFNGSTSDGGRNYELVEPEINRQSTIDSQA